MTQEEFLLRIAELLETAGIAFMVAGSHASSHHGHPRTTHDVDVVIEATPAQLDRFLSLLGDDYYASPETAHEALARRSTFNVLHLDSGWKVDLIVRKDRPFSIEEFRRRHVETLHGRPLPIASAEDVILTKLEWNKITPSERQLRDALNVAVVKWQSLDQAYLRHWAGALGVSEKLEELLRNAEQQQTS
jgi:hypothetical protein